MQDYCEGMTRRLRMTTALALALVATTTLRALPRAPPRRFAFSGTVASTITTSMPIVRLTFSTPDR